MRLLLEAIKKAHIKTGAPGDVVALFPETSQYLVQLQYGTQRFRYSDKGNKVTVVARWGSNSKQATVRVERKVDNS